MTTQLLTLNNYHQGFLVDDELMAGVSQNPEDKESFIAYVIQHTTGEYLGYQSFKVLELALQAINQIPRAWKFEAVGGCGGCGQGGGSCRTDGSGGCSIKKCGDGACSTAQKLSNP